MTTVTLTVTPDQLLGSTPGRATEEDPVTIAEWAVMPVTTKEEIPLSSGEAAVAQLLGKKISNTTSKDAETGRHQEENGDATEEETDEEEESMSMVRMMLNLENKEVRRSSQLFDQLSRRSNSDLATHEEMAKFLATNHSLWTMLSLNFGLSKEQSTRVATEVAMVLATGCEDRTKAMQQQLSREQFTTFRKDYILDQAGSQEFFLRAVFATFDKDKNNALCEKELDSFLDVFYLGSGVFQGPTDLDFELPPKDHLRELLLEQFDTTNNKTLISFQEIGQVVKTADGTGGRLAFTAEMESSIHESIRGGGGSLRGSLPGSSLRGSLRGSIRVPKHARRRRMTTTDIVPMKLPTKEEEAVALEEQRELPKSVLHLEDDIQEEVEEFDFCTWLDRLFFPSSYVNGKRVDGKETLCMRLSRHGSKHKSIQGF